MKTVKKNGGTVTDMPTNPALVQPNPNLVAVKPEDQKIVREFDQELAKQKMELANLTVQIELMKNKRREVVKLASLSLVVVLALALHQWITFVVDRYVSNARLTLQQETILRLSYPVFVLFFLWHLKAQSAKTWTD